VQSTHRQSPHRDAASEQQMAMESLHGDTASKQRLAIESSHGDRANVQQIVSLVATSKAACAYRSEQVIMTE
jgi:hypothetical protein